MTRPVLSGSLERWSILFNQYEITYTRQKDVKEQALANFLSDHPLPAEWELSDKFPDEDILFIEEFPPWKIFFDGSAHRNGAGAGETCSNNAAEYQTLIVGLEMALLMKILQLEIYNDSKLIINQLLGSYEVKKEDLLPYHQYAYGLLERFNQVFLNHVLREENCIADALANLAITMALRENESTKKRIGGKLPEDLRQRTNIKRRAPRFIFYKGTLFRRFFEGLFLRCLDKEEVHQAMEEAHSGSCGAHHFCPKLHFHIKRMGYYWPTMMKDYMKHAKRYQVCQFHANYIHQPPEPLHPTVASWPFDVWGLDIVGLLPKSSEGQMYIIPRYIITDNGMPFDNKLVRSLCEKFGFKQHKSSMYNAPANGLAKAFNKTLGNLLKKVVAKNNRD
ncbi:uncharacterized protein LOC142178948 [Nicotiana tabacum]|uniref:Uncharacterized protein LOC142178948 n=1 Tax=Nicotiana tabacum TaxID=4097 RepID=A0AC58U5V8_TOBAC